MFKTSFMVHFLLHSLKWSVKLRLFSTHDSEEKKKRKGNTLLIQLLALFFLAEGGVELHFKLLPSKNNLVV